MTLIDTDSAINEISRFVGYLDDDMILRLQIALNRLPTIDAVPVVRCKECKWLDYCDTQEGKEYLCCREGFPVDLNDFCSWGEKVTE